MKVLAVSDVEVNFIYSPSIEGRFKDADFVVSCGDLPYSYIEYIHSMLNVDLYYVHGNHDRTEYRAGADREKPWGGIHLHRRCVKDHRSGVLLAGFDGSLSYNRGAYQFSQFAYWEMVLRLVPRLLYNRVRHGRYLDVLVTHAPSWGIHDDDDLPHQGIKAFLWLVRVFQPALHLHGHVHMIGLDRTGETILGRTRIINTYGYKEIKLDLD